MTVPTTTSRADYIGSGSTGPFSFSFRILAASHLRVIRTSSAGVATTLTNGIDYTVSGAGSYSGGSITLTVALAVGESLAMRRVVPLTQLTDYINQGAYYAETVEDALDLAVMMQQQQQDSIDRSLHLPEGEAGSDLLIVLPALATRKGKQLGFDPTTGQPTATSPASAAVSAAMQPVTASATLALARAAMGAQGALAVTIGDGAYVCDSTGVSDCTAVFQAALTASDVVLVPPGTYLLGTLNLKANNQLIGIGRPTLKYKDATGDLFTVPTNGGFVRLSDFVATTLNPAHTAGWFFNGNDKYGSLQVFERLVVTGFLNGILLTQATDQLIRQVYLNAYSGAAGVGVQLGSAGQNVSTAIVDHVYIGGAYHTGIKFVNASVCQILSPIVEYCTRGIDVSGAINSTIYEAYFELNTTDTYNSGSADLNMRSANRIVSTGYNNKLDIETGNLNVGPSITGAVNLNVIALSGTYEPIIKVKGPANSRISFETTAANDYTGYLEWADSGGTECTLSYSWYYHTMKLVGSDFNISTIGKGLNVIEGTNARQGTATLVAGTVTVPCTAVTANSRIFLTAQNTGGTPGALRVSARVAGTSFTITSTSGTDTSLVAYEIFEPGT